VNNSINAEFNFAEADISIFRNFPNATVVIKDISLVNVVPFEGDTLFYAEETALAMSIKELFKSQEETFLVKSFKINNADVNVLVNAEGAANYDIAKETPQTQADTTAAGKGFKFTIEEYEITNSDISYLDKSSNIKLELTDFVHFGKGDFSKDQFDLD